MNYTDRRNFLKQGTTLAASLMIPRIPLPSQGPKMGVSVASYAIRWHSETPSQTYPGFANALSLLDHCHQIGAGGVQAGVRNWNRDFAGKVRDKREKLGLYLEGQIRLPKSEEDLNRFESEVKAAKEAGASIIRTVCLGGRRYETFQSLESFQEFQLFSYQSLEWAEPIMRKHKVKLAVENHKDWRVPELLAIMKHLESEWVGITLDMGNSISLLEDPMYVVESLAPYTLTTHFKDMAFEEYEDGFLLSEVPLGQGTLDLERMVQVCRKHNPGVTFNLEMITRDPLKIPCLTESYWATFEDLPGQDLAYTLQSVRKRSTSEAALPSVSERTPEDRLAFEEKNVLESFTYAKNTLNLG